MKRIRVTVTQDDIDNGLRYAGSACPLARALRRRFPFAVVGSAIWRPDGSLTAPLPLDAIRFVVAFDCDRAVKPATFLLPVPE